MSNWGNEPEKVGPVSSGGAGWLNLKEGQYRVRLVSGYAYIGYHFNNQTKKSTVCPNRYKGDDLCDQCRFLKDQNGKLYTVEKANAIRDAEKAAGRKEPKFFWNRATQRYIVNILDLNDLDEDGIPNIKHCEFPFKLIEILNAYKIDPDYHFDDLPEWDMTITKNVGDAKTDVNYIVSPARNNRTLTQAETEKVGNAPTPEQVVNKKHNYAERDAEENDPSNQDSLARQADQEVSRQPITEQDVEDTFEIEKSEPVAKEGDKKEIDPELGF